MHCLGILLLCMYMQGVFEKNMLGCLLLVNVVIAMFSLRSHISSWGIYWDENIFLSARRLVQTTKSSVLANATLGLLWALCKPA
jgi:hypothetical protein